MSNIFRLDGPFYQLLERIADFFIINFLTVVCSLPVFTAGAAIVANQKVMQNFLSHIEQPVTRVYFRAFRDNFKQATIVWLLTIIIAAFLAGDFFIIHTHFSTTWKTPLFAFLGIVCFLFLGAISYIFPLIARYDNMLRTHIQNGVFLAASHIPRTIIMVCTYVVPLVLVVCFPEELLFGALLFWVTFGVSIFTFLEARLIKPILVKLEDAASDAEVISE